jgi:hypothetical protein
MRYFPMLLDKMKFGNWRLWRTAVDFVSHPAYWSIKKKETVCAYFNNTTDKDNPPKLG